MCQQFTFRRESVIRKYDVEIVVNRERESNNALIPATVQGAKSALQTN